MSIYESGYFQKGIAFMLRGKNYGTMALIDDYLLFTGKKGRTMEIPLSNIKSIEHSGAKVIFTLKESDIWSFAIAPYWRAFSTSEAIEFKRKAESMCNLLKHLISKL